MAIRRTLTLTGVVWALAVGCEPQSLDRGEHFVVADSAGVLIAENAWSNASISDWEPEEPPIMRLGSERADAPDLFGRVSQAVLDPQGNLWVVDLMAAEARVFDVPTGEHLFTVGGRGRGPGEFLTVHLLGFDETRAWVWDQNLGRLTVFTLEGEFLEVQVPGRDREMTPRLLARTPAGTFITTLPQILSRAVTDGMNVRDTIRLWEFETDVNEAGLVAERAGVIWHFGGGGQLQVPFTDGGRFAARDRWVVFTDPEGTPELEVFEGGRLVRRIRVRRALRPVTDQAVATHLEVTGATRSGVDAARLPIPRFAPAWGWLQVGEDGSILAMHHWGLDMGASGARAIWDVFDPEGRLQASIRLPEGTGLLEFGREYLVLTESIEGAGPGLAVYPVPEWRTRM
jgi:hypothetical protein